MAKQDAGAGSRKADPTPPVADDKDVIAGLPERVTQLEKTIHQLDPSSFAEAISKQIAEEVSRQLANAPVIAGPAGPSVPAGDEANEAELHDAAAALKAAGVKVQRIEQFVDDDGNPAERIIKAGTPTVADVLAARATATGWSVVIVDGERHEVEA